MTENQKLLAEFVESHSESAFSELVVRYINLVYSTAYRLIKNDKHLAEDVAQTVFVDLARMAKGLPKNVLLGGWLHRHTCYLTATMMRSERRRLVRQTKVTEMSSNQDHTATNLADLRPVLDEAINQLDIEDRNAILLRFFDQCDFRTIGEAVGSSEDAARKRIDRALEKLRALLQRRGVALSTGALAATLATEVARAAPFGLVTTITSAAISGAALSTFPTLNFFKTLIMTKANAGILALLLIAGVATPLLMAQQSRRKLGEENVLLRHRIEQMTQSRDEANRLSNPRPASVHDENFHELLRLRGQVAVLRKELFDQTSRAKMTLERAQEKTADPDPLFSRTFKVDSKKFLENLHAKFSSNALSPNAGQPASFDSTTDAAGADENGIAGDVSASSPSEIQMEIRRFFTAAGVDFSNQAAGKQGFGILPSEPNPEQKSMFFNDRTGILLVRASSRDLDLIEETVRALNAAPGNVAAETN